jgi:hypothetical protein
MRFAIFTCLSILLLSLAGDALGQTNGMFGPRNLGSPIKPGVSQFDDSLQRGPSGDFLSTGRPAGQNMFTTPWQQPSEAPVYLPFAYGMLPNGQLAAIPPNMITPGGAVLPIAPPPETAAEAAATAQPEGPLPPEGPAGYGVPVPPAAMPVAPPSGGGSAPNNVSPPPPAAPSAGGKPASAGGATPVAVDYTSLLGWTAESAAPAPGGVSPAGTQLETAYLPDLSQRLTQTARDHGMQLYAPIRVSLASGTAIVRGMVGTAHDRLLIANMVLLEPGIDQVNNRMIVAPAGVPAAR